MLNKVLDYIQEYDMLEPGDRVVVGVSGGADSVALIHLLWRMREFIPMNLYVAHVDHGIRGEAAREDALFVEAMATEWGLDFFLKEASVPDLVKEWGVSEEQAGRRVRHEFYREVRQRVGAQRIALGHHRDDQVETILYNIIRGSGLAGLSGMDPVRDGIIIRPLLGVSRQEIEDYCHREGLGFRHDHTNEETIYTRNRVRHMVIPMIEEHFNPNFSAGLTRMGDILRDDEEFLRSYSEDAFSRVAKFHGTEVRYSLGGFRKYPKAIKRRLLRDGLLRMKKNLVDIHHIHIDGIMDLAEGSEVGSSLDLPDNFKARVDYNDLVLYRNHGVREEDLPVPDFEYELKNPGRTHIPQLGMAITLQEVTDFKVLNGDYGCIYIDADSIQGGLYIRNRRDGDRFRPLGMSGTKKLKDFFIDRKVPRHKRDSIPLVVDRNNIIWIAGYQMSEDYKVTHNTKRLIRMEIEED
ncbi:MAG TPA: tRNA lysidine(34) synthetase TilS [Clostridia bacterium]|nr:tRNA lysidine(34) synthetase TilS [Clostridia bacterium]